MTRDVRFFTDRGIGSHIVPEGLRRAGWNVVTMDERYGTQRSQSVADETWIRDASREGDVLIAKDRRVAKRPLEAAVIRESRARVFVITSAQITGVDMLERLLRNEGAIRRQAGERGPYVFGVDVGRLHRIRLA